MASPTPNIKRTFCYSINPKVKKADKSGMGAYDIRIAEENAGQEIAQLPTRPTGPDPDQPKRPTLP